MHHLDLGSPLLSAKVHEVYAVVAVDCTNVKLLLMRLLNGNMAALRHI